MFGMDLKKMRSKFFLAILLLTPILVVTFSTFYFLMGMSPEGSKNNGVFFKSYFDLNDFKNDEGKQDLLLFDDGKWILSVYVTDLEASEQSIFLARQLNVALNRDINKLKRVIFYSNKLLESNLKELKTQYPRIEIVEDKNGVLLNVLQRNSALDFNIKNPIFVIDPYGRAVMYFLPDTDPKLILKDLKVLI
tara:strand:- start:1236 stop:1811 length:576 start_codon:yes stop_codon:yes gene_type:complete